MVEPCPALPKPHSFKLERKIKSTKKIVQKKKKNTEKKKRNKKKLKLFGPPQCRKFRYGEAGVAQKTYGFLSKLDEEVGKEGSLIARGKRAL